MQQAPAETSGSQFTLSAEDIRRFNAEIREDLVQKLVRVAR